MTRRFISVFLVLLLVSCGGGSVPDVTSAEWPNSPAIATVMHDAASSVRQLISVEAVVTSPDVVEIGVLATAYAIDAKFVSSVQASPLAVVQSGSSRHAVATLEIESHAGSVASIYVSVWAVDASGNIVSPGEHSTISVTATP